MSDARNLDALCESCNDVTIHELLDAGSCRCGACGTVQQLVATLA